MNSYDKCMESEVLNKMYEAMKGVKWMPKSGENMDNCVTQQRPLQLTGIKFRMKRKFYKKNVSY